ncbi:DUF305 domain-containing protein [Ensifer aridi]|uniref:CopM family metallochaperone n=1 Tax=Ensifer aridi TaxID=1708715 RepID=UPI00061516EA|nr:DUF305 domain-containing protein [Ensifer aridi]
MSPKSFTAVLLLATVFTTPAFAQDNGHSGIHHGSMEMTGQAGEMSASSKAFAEANAKMHKDMDIVFSGNTDVDFVRGMIAHHQGAIDMAKVELQYGKDDAIRKLAEDIIKAQEAEIKMMREWLAKNGG